MALPATKSRDERRIGAGTTSAAKAKPKAHQPPHEWPVWAIKMRQQYEAKIKQLEDRVRELEATIVTTDNARRQAQQQESALAIYGESEEVKALTARLGYLLPNADEIGQQGVALVSQIAIAHGLDPLPGSDHVYAWKKGGKLTVVIGYKGMLHLARQQVHFTHQSREMTEEERAKRLLNEDQIGYVTEIWEIEKAKACKDAGIPYHPIRGEAIWSPTETHYKKDGSTYTTYNDVPRGRDGHWVARKNSLKDALRQITSTGVRLGQALDTMFAEMGRQAALQASGLDVEATGDGWQIALPDGSDEQTPEELEQELIDEGYIQPNEPINGQFTAKGDKPDNDEQDQSETPAEPAATEVKNPETPADKKLDKADAKSAPKCANCGIEDADPDNPIDPTLCATCAGRKADQEAQDS